MRIKCLPWITLLISLSLFAGTLQNASATDVVRIAFIDPLSGPFANTGELALKHFQAAVSTETVKRKMNAKRFEVVAYDNKGSVQETHSMFQRAVDNGIRFVVQGQGSAAALALLHAVETHNARHPDRTVLYLNYAALDPDLTNARCSFWHFRFDASVDMRLRALLSTVLLNPAPSKLYLINQDYSFGHHVARIAKEVVNQIGSNGVVVGEDLHPIGTVKDFSPYILKAKRANADVIITGNWGVDLALLIKAGRDLGYTGRFLTFYAGVPGAVTAIGKAESGRISQVNEWHPNVTANGIYPYQSLASEFRKQFRTEFYFPRIYTLVDFLATAFQVEPTGRPELIAHALEGMRLSTPLGTATIRQRDHQLIQPLYVSTLVTSAKLGGPKEVLYESEGTGMGFQTIRRLDANETAPNTSCLMSRPIKGMSKR